MNYCANNINRNIKCAFLFSILTFPNPNHPKMSVKEMSNFAPSDECLYECYHGGKCVYFQFRSMCNCKTGFTGDACQLRHYDTDLWFVYEDDWKSKFDQMTSHILRYQMALSAVMIIAFAGLIFGVWRFKRIDSKFMRLNKKAEMDRKIVRLISDSSEPSSSSPSEAV